MSMPESPVEVAITPDTSPSPISMMRAPASRTLAISSAWRGRSRMQTTRSATSTFLALARSARFCAGRLVEIDDAVGQAAADRDLVHVDVGRIEEAAMLGHRHDGQRIGQALGGDGGAFQRIERDVDLGARRRRPSRRYRASAPRRARPRRSPRCRRWRATLSAVRMASTAAWSAIFSSPRPISLEAASAAASVTRTASSARLRSILPMSAIASSVGV